MRAAPSARCRGGGGRSRRGCPEVFGEQSRVARHHPQRFLEVVGCDVGELLESALERPAPGCPVRGCAPARRGRRGAASACSASLRAVRSVAMRHRTSTPDIQARRRQQDRHQRAVPRRRLASAQVVAPGATASSSETADWSAPRTCQSPGTHQVRRSRPAGRPASGSRTGRHRARKRWRRPRPCPRRWRGRSGRCRSTGRSARRRAGRRPPSRSRRCGWPAAPLPDARSARATVAGRPPGRRSHRAGQRLIVGHRHPPSHPAVRRPSEPAATAVPAGGTALMGGPVRRSAAAARPAPSRCATGRR